MWLTSDEKGGNVKATGAQSFYWGEEVYRISENLPYDGQCCFEMKMERTILILWRMWKNPNLMQNLYIIINQLRQWCTHTHTHKCCDIGHFNPESILPEIKVILN